MPLRVVAVRTIITQNDAPLSAYEQAMRLAVL
jgi:hypothetical protein